MFWETKLVFETGRFIVRPLYDFFDLVLVRIDVLRFGCMEPYSPDFITGMVILWIGYSGTFWLAWTWIVHEINRRRMRRH